ncbi:MAG: hypothetical protein WB341_15940 [Terracidiphilus sp.]
MNNQLRPLTLGEILDRTAELYRNHFLIFAGISALFAGTMLLVQMLHLAALALLGYPHIPAHLEWAYAVTIGVEVLAIALVAGLSIAAFNRAVAWIYLGEPATVRAAAGSVFSRLSRYLWLMTVMMFRAWAPLFLMYVALFGLLFAVMPSGFLFSPQVASHPPAMNPSTAVGVLLSLLVLFPLFFLSVVYGVFMWLRYSLAMPACVVEGLPTGQAIQRSIELSKGSRGRIFVLWLLVYVIRLLLDILFAFPFLIFGIKHPGQQLPLGWLGLSEVAGFVTNTFIGPIYSTGLTLFYYDQRIRKEGFDIEWMMQAAGLTSQPELPAPERA